MPANRRVAWVLATLLVAHSLIAWADSGTVANELTLAFIPQENPEKLVGDIAAIGRYLEYELGVPVRGFITADHAAAIEALRNGDAVISFMGGLPYVLAHRLAGAEVLLGEVYRGQSSYRGRIFVRRDRGIASLEDLRSKTIAFADPVSESGYLYPLEIFADAGLIERGTDPQSFFKRVYFAGGYQQAIQAVASGFVDAAGASQYAELLLDRRQLAEITWIAETRAIPSHAVVGGPALDPTLKQAFVEAMLKLNQPKYRSLLKHVYGPDGYVVVSHEAYLGVEEVARGYGFLR